MAKKLTKKNEEDEDIDMPLDNELVSNDDDDLDDFDNAYVEPEDLIILDDFDDDDDDDEDY